MLTELMSTPGRGLWSAQRLHTAAFIWGQTCEGPEAGAALVDGGEADGAQADAVVEPVLQVEVQVEVEVQAQV